MKTVATTKKRNYNNTNSNEKKDKFIEKILENLDQVNEKDWEMYSDFSNYYPSNLFTKKQYNGFNVMALFIHMMMTKSKSAKYATFNSISKAGGKLKKGSKGCVIEFFSYIYKEKNNKIVPLEVVKKMTLEQIQLLSKIPCLRNYVVFNAEQIENLEELDFNLEIEEPTENEIKEIENCENFIEKIKVNGLLNLQFGTEETAYYSPVFDLVKLPKREFFLSGAKYYGTLFHEIIHWTGHESRLNRELKGHNDKNSYSFEELIAEMGSMLCCLQFGIYDEFINSVRYLKGWSKYTNIERETAIRKAFIGSKKAKKYLEKL